MDIIVRPDDVEGRRNGASLFTNRKNIFMVMPGVGLEMTAVKDLGVIMENSEIVVPVRKRELPLYSMFIDQHIVGVFFLEHSDILFFMSPSVTISMVFRSARRLTAWASSVAAR
jgi:hypothetical protein